MQRLPLTDCYFRKYLKTPTPFFLKWAIDQLVRWKNQTKIEALYHIHGTQDRLLPIAFVNCDARIAGGGHLMTLNKAAELNAILSKQCWILSTSWNQWYFQYKPLLARVQGKSMRTVVEKLLGPAVEWRVFANIAPGVLKTCAATPSFLVDRQRNRLHSMDQRADKVK